MPTTHYQTALAALRANGWENLDPWDAGHIAFVQRVADALANRDRDALAFAIIGGGTLGEVLELADALLAEVCHHNAVMLAFE